MKTKLYKFLIISLVTVFGITGFTSCGDDVTEQYYVGAQMFTRTFTVGVNDWTWNESDGRYECFFDFPELTAQRYNNGAVSASVFVNPRNNDDEVQHPLPFVYTYINEGSTVPYTETMSCDMIPGNAGFFIQNSNRTRDDQYLADYEFKVVVFWDESAF